MDKAQNDGERQRGVRKAAGEHAPNLVRPLPGKPKHEGGDDQAHQHEKTRAKAIPPSAAAKARQDPAAIGRARAAALNAQHDLEEHMKMVADSWIKNHPTQAKLIRIKTEVKAVPRQGGNTSKAYDLIIERILTVEGAVSTQTAIAQYVQSTDSSLTPPKDWNKPFQGWAIKRLKASVAKAPSPFNDIRVTSRTTLASLHRAARTRASQQALDGIRFKAEITITQQHVIINGQSWRINSPAKGARRIIISEQALLKLA